MTLVCRVTRIQQLALLALVLAFNLSAFGQTESATISGTITDQVGAIVPGADVKLTNVETGITTTTKSNAAGLYVFPTVRPGLYRMLVNKIDFRQIVLTDLTVNVQDTLSRNFRLQLGVVGESVTVTGTAVGKLNTQSASVSTVVDSQFVENMPLNGRSFQSLIYLTPGVAFTPTVSTVVSGTFNVNGQRSDANYITVDGVSANVGTTQFVFQGNTVGGTSVAVNAEGGTNGLVSVDAMQQFRVQTSSFAPQYGRTPGAQISIATKGGTNLWHGTAFDYLRNDFFDARNYYNNAHPENGLPAEVKPALRANDFGGTVGGPIWKDHTFFFFSYEGFQLRLPQFNLGYFLNAESIANASPVWQPFLAASPVPSAGAPYFKPFNAAGGVGNCDNGNPANSVPGNPSAGDVPCLQEVPASDSSPSTANNYSLRLDHNLTKKITVFARYNHAPSYAENVVWNFTNQQIIDLDSVTAGVTYAVSPTMVNNFRANVSRTTGSYAYGQNATFGAVLPGSSVLLWPVGTGWNAGNASTGFGYAEYDIGGGSVQGYNIGNLGGSVQRQLQFLDTLSRSVGVHQLKFGVDFRRIQPTSGPSNSVGGQAYDWLSVQAGTVDGYANVSTQPAITAHIYNWSFFGQDTWRVKPRLTLTYGLRWEMNTPLVSDTPGVQLYPVEGIFDSNPLQLGTPGAPLWHAQKDAFAPRIGVAYQIASTTVVRGGFGFFYDLGYSGSLSNIMGGGVFPWSRSHSYSECPPSQPAGPCPLDLTNPVYQPPAFSTAITSGTFDLTAVDPRLRLPVTYQWNAAFERELGSNQTITATYVGAYGSKLLRSDRIVPPGSVLNGSGYDVLAVRNASYSHYNSLQLQYLRRMSHGLQALFAYTYSHSSDLGSGDQNGFWSPSVSSVVTPPLSPSDYNIPNNISVAISYESPKLAWGGKAGRAILNGWGLDGIVRHQSGQPLTCIVIIVTQAGNVYGICDRVPGQPLWIPNASEPNGKQLNPAAFAAPANPPYGTAGRNSIQSPYDYNQIDLAARKQFNITERVKLTLRMDYFNLFNHPMWGGYASAPSTYWGLVSPSGGFQFNTFGTVVPVTLNQINNGGQNALYSPGGPRSGQISLKLTF